MAKNKEKDELEELTTINIRKRVNEALKKIKKEQDCKTAEDVIVMLINEHNDH